MRALRLAVVFALALPVLACEQLDSVTLLHDLRVLAIKTEPAELKLPASYFVRTPGMPPGAGLQEWDVDVTVYAFDPRGGLVRTHLFLCPEYRNDPACLDQDPRQEIPEDAEPLVAAELAAVFGGQFREASTADPVSDPAALVGDGMYRFHFSSAVIDSLIGGANGVAQLSLAPLLPRFAIDIESSPGEGVDREIAFKRLPLSLDFSDPRLPAETVGALLGFSGTTACGAEGLPEPFEQGPAPCFQDLGANHNPVLLGFDLVDTEAEALAIEAGEEIPAVRFGWDPQLGTRPVLRVQPGAVLDIRPVFAPGTMEPYQVFTLDPESQTTGVENRYEDFVCNWVVTRGEVSQQTTSTEPGAGGGGGGSGGGGPGGGGSPFGEDLTSLDGRWELPDSDLVNAGERDALVMVVKDQRGGVAIGQITVEYGQ